MSNGNQRWAAIPPGVIAPVLTPFNDDLSIATDLYLANARRLLSEGCVALAPFGTTGEALSVGTAERLGMIEKLAESGVDAARLIPGTGLTNLPETAELTRGVLELGCAAAMILPPFYFKDVSDDGLYSYFARLIETVARDDLAIFLYHIPQVSGVGLGPDLVGRLKRDFPDQIVGIKDSSGDWDNTRALFEIEDLIVYPGSELPLIEALDLGGKGCISATANLNARAIADIIRLHTAGRRDDAIAAFDAVRRFRLTVQGYAPIPAQKRLLALSTGDARWANVRPPLDMLDVEDGEALLHQLETAGLFGRTTTAA